jgi:hypothetical protein
MLKFIQEANVDKNQRIFWGRTTGFGNNNLPYQDEQQDKPDDTLS